ncbi:SURF1 family cytochrome oxidase biogenesis protein [Rothia sp. ZJ1223]|uniref:SURF1 family protein n=1 Tax=Rothia sp. ZJ1223 TaxID=2811098 RepID=UPI00195D59E8|nr:hypothetical protein [Rothia sp. ZJ1223]
MIKQALTPRWLGFLALVLALVTAFVMLSAWQLNASISNRVYADPDKDRVRAYTEVMKANAPLIARESDTVVKATGSYVPGSSYLVANHYDGDQRGYWVVSQFVPEDGQQVELATSSATRSIAVARAWVATADDVPADPVGKITVAGRVVPNEAPVRSNSLEGEGERVLGSVATAYLSNLWQVPLYSSILTAATEVPQGEELLLTDEGTIVADATIIGAHENVRPVKPHQVEDASFNWLNIFYSLEWIVFAGFALYLWWRMLKDSVEKQEDPAQYFEYDGEYFKDEESGRYYYWDPADQKYYFFDEVPGVTTSTSLGVSNPHYRA